MSEFDIRIGTQLDTSNAEKQLMDFIKKHSDGKPITFKVDVKGASGSKGIKDTEKSFKNVLNTAKQIGNTKIDVSKMLGSVTDSVARGLNRTVDNATKKLVTTVGRTKRDLIEDAQLGISKTVASINSDVKETQRNLNNMIKDFSKAKNVKFIDQKSLKEGLDQLDKIRSMEVTVGNVKEVNSQLASIADNYRKMMSDASREAFKDIKLTPLIDNLKEVRTAMSAKNMDLSGIDNLIERTNKLSSLSISEILVEYEKIRSEFSKELKIPLNLNSIMNAETAIKNILKYKDELVSQVKVETDDSKIKKLNQEIQDCDKFVEILNKDLNAVGKSTVKNLIDSSNKKEVEDLNKQYDKLGKAIKDLNKSDNLKFIELGKLTEIKNAYDNIGKSINKIDFKNVDDGQVIKVTNDVANLKKVIEDTSQSANNLSIKAKIDIGLKNAEQMLLGMESALVKTGKRTGVLKGLKEDLEKVISTVKVDPSKGLADLDVAFEKIRKQADVSGLKNITGDLSQYEKYINDYISLTKKASNTKDLGLAKTYEQEAKRTLKALDLLEQGMTQSQKGTANGLRLEAQAKANEEFNNSISKTISSLKSYKQELQSVNKEVGFDKLVSKAGENARQEYENMISSANKMQNALNNMLSSGKVDTTNLAKINDELNKSRNNLDKFKNTSINIKCKEAIADLKELRKEEEKLGHNVSGIDSNIKRIENLQSQLSKGLVGGNQVSKEIDTIEKEYSSMAKLTKQVSSAQKEYKKLVDTVSGLKQDGKLENRVFNSLDKQAENLKDKFTNLNFGTLTAVEVSKITGAVEKFASSVNNAKATDLHLRLKADFDIDASKANVKINGLESALLANGEDTKVVKSLRNKLKKYIETAVDDPALASKGVAGLLDNIANVTASKDLGKITGDLAQYKKYISEIESLSSKASKTTDEALAKKYQSQDKALRGALAKLESGFDEKTLKTATTLRDNAFDGISDNIAKEVDKVKDKINEYKTTMQNATKGYDVSKFTSNIGKGLAEQFDQGISKADELEAKLNEILSSKNVDVSALTKIRNEIENLQKSTSGFKTSVADTAIRESFDNIQIPNLNNMLKAVKDVMSAKNVDTSGIDKLIARTKDLANVDVSRLSSEFKAIQDELAKEVNVRLGAKGVKTVEDVLNVILKHRNELERQISMEVDSSKVKQLNGELEKTNKVINSLGGKTGSLGGALIDNADVSNVKQLESALGNVEKRYNNLASKTDKLKGNNFVDISELRNTLELSESIKKTLNDVKVNPTSNGISKLNSELSKLEQTIKNTEQNAKNIKLGINFDSNLEKAGSMINGIEASLIKLGQSSDKLNEFKSKFESIKDLSKVNLSGAISQLDDLIRKMKEFGSEKGLGDISGTISQYKKYYKELEQARLGAIKSSGTDEAKGYEQTASRIENATKRLVQSFKEAQQESANTFKSDSFNDFSSKVNKEINSVINDINKFQSSMKNLDKIVDFGNLSGDVGKGLAEEFSSIMNKIDEVRNKLKNMELTPNIDLTEITKAKDELKDLENQADQLKKVSIMLKCSDSISELDKLESRMKEIGRSADGIDELRNKFLTLGSGIKEGTADIEGAVKELKNLTNQADKFGKSFERSLSGGSGGNFGSKIQGFFQDIKQSFSQFTIGELMADAIQQGIYSIKDVVMELDSALADFARVAPDDFTINSVNLEKVASTAKQIAIDVGQSTSDVITGMSTALQAGARTMEQATAIAKQSAIFQNVTDMSAEESSKAVATMVNQYFGMDKALAQVDKGVGATRKGYDNLTQAMDLANYAGNNFAISSEGVTQALSRGGSVLSNYGVSIADSVALISSANESIQDPQRVGNGLKTIALNLSGMKTNAKTGAMELNKTAKALQDIAGIDIFTDKSKTQTKDMMTLMNEIKGKWGELTDAQQKALSEGIAGKTQAQVFQSLMNGWSRVKEFQDAYNKGWTIGSAQRENEIFLDSLAGKWNTLKENLTKGLTSVGVRDTLKDVLDIANNVVLAVEKITSSLGGIGTAGALVGLTSFVKTMSNLDKAMTFGTAFSKFDNILDSIQGASGISGTLSSLTSGFKNLGLGVTASKVALGLFKGALMGIGFALVIGAIQKAIQAWNDYTHATENAIKASKEKQDGYRDEAQRLSTQKSQLQDVAKEYDTLNSKANKTAEDLQRLNELKQEIAQIAPDLVKGYDSAGNPILALNDSMQDYINSLDKAIAKQDELFNKETKRQAREYMKQNDGGSAQNVETTHYETQLDQLNNANWRKAKAEETYSGNLIKILKNRNKDRLKQEEQYYKDLEKIQNSQSEVNTKDSVIESNWINEFNKSTKLAEKDANSFANFMSTLNWGTYGEKEASRMGNALQKLSE